MPKCRLIAGPNGAGKTTFALTYLPRAAGRIHFVNADMIAAGLSPFAPERGWWDAGRIFLRETRRHIAVREDFALETTLAGRTCLPLVNRLRANGWCVDLIYLALPDVGMSKLRVAERVAHGGHNIPATDIERRFPRSLRHLFVDFSHRVDHCTCLMNNGERPTLVFDQRGHDRVIINDSHYRHLLVEANR